MSRQELDLEKLRLDRSIPPSSPPRSRRWFSRYLLPAGLVFGFVGLLGVAAGHQMLPRPVVTVMPVIVKRGEVGAPGSPRFQAAGWIEPRPTAVSVAALAPGIVDELLVVAGQLVKKGEPIARLVDVDAELAVQRAEASLAIQEGELQRVRAQHSAALTRLQNPVHLKAQLADAQSLLAKAITETEKLPYQIRAAEANVEFTKSSLQGKRAAGSAIAGVIVQESVRDHAAAVASLEELQKRLPNMERERDALRQKVDALQTQLELLVEERRQVDESAARVDSTAATLDEAQLQLRLAQLNLQRMVVRAPMKGRILRLVASPGTRVMGLEHTAGQSSSTVVEMYDPDRLQVRADVRLEDVPMVTPGAPVRIETASSSGAMRGRVLQPTSSANVQKNTLEVKIELIDPPSTVSPEMLVTATFLSARPDVDRATEMPAARLLVPKQLVQSVDGGHLVWTVDAQDRAIPRSVTLDPSATGPLAIITDGLSETDKLIASGTDDLNPGTQVRIGGEDVTIGLEK